MTKSSPTASDLFSTRELERLYELLKSKSIEGHWKVGRILNTRLGERAPYGILAKLKVALPKLGAEMTRPRPGLVWGEALKKARQPFKIYPFFEHGFERGCVV
ncbi:MAG: hypothetical protein WCT04_25015 [Planctomycetota bacterium]